jgi:HD-like signal output (HDOD) protein
MPFPVSHALLCPAHLDNYLREMPVATAVLSRLQGLLLSDDVAIPDVLELVRLDPALAARVMTAAGSVWYGRGGKVHSLDEALARLGCREAYRIVAAFALGKHLNAPLRIYGLPPRDFWRFSLGSALVLDAITAEAGADESIGYTIGLLHLVGMVFIDRHLRTVDPDCRLTDHPSAPLLRQEARLVGMHHAQVGGLVLEKWNFAPAIVEPVRWQYEPSHCPPEFADAAERVAAARPWVARLVAGPPPPAEPEPEWMAGVRRRFSAAAQWLV